VRRVIVGWRISRCTRGRTVDVFCGPCWSSALTGRRTRAAFRPACTGRGRSRLHTRTAIVITRTRKQRNAVVRQWMTPGCFLAALARRSRPLANWLSLQLLRCAPWVEPERGRSSRVRKLFFSSPREFSGKESDAGNTHPKWVSTAAYFL
jgi:hypothetical protein